MRLIRTVHTLLEGLLVLVAAVAFTSTWTRASPDLGKLTKHTMKMPSEYIREVSTRVQAALVPIFSQHAPDLRAALTFLLDSQRSGMGDTLGDVGTTSSLVLKLAEARIAAEDLISLIESSSLEHREEMQFLLLKFADDARDTIRALQQLSARLQSGGDRVAVTLDSARRLLSPSLHDSNSATYHQSPTNDDRTTRAYEYALTTIEGVLRSLVLSAETAFASLEALDARLLAIGEASALEGLAIRHAREDVLYSLWTYLGGNREQLNHFDRDAVVLNSVSDYKKLSLTYIQSVSRALEAMQAGLDETRRIASGALLIEQPTPQSALIIIAKGYGRLKGEAWPEGVVV
ncbi:uncharacterized protein B0H18DRAFT_1113836 [Fomitopsis serialis]|uniref:uncharacterized protein n=1 Tax=Fomitopsis serialis TaxID=139415 RepID=UPI0020086A10|nr:uncharacterized protein B0H18DRAFT_1113836 [Neoantrodia serialis]KAH9936451.1 hypothetical protein B0H18DRAFT_1113836 [Neoantrodia serialis]